MSHSILVSRYHISDELFILICLLDSSHVKILVYLYELYGEDRQPFNKNNTCHHTQITIETLCFREQDLYITIVVPQNYSMCYPMLYSCRPSVYFNVSLCPYNTQQVIFESFSFFNVLNKRYYWKITQTDCTKAPCHTLTTEYMCDGYLFERLLLKMLP